MQFQEIFQIPLPFDLPNDIVEVPPAILLVVASVPIARFLPPLVARAVIATTHLRFEPDFSDSRRDTVSRFVTDMTRGSVFVLFGLLILALFVDTAGLLTFLGLFTAAFGLAVRPLVSDSVSGFIFILEDQYEIGDDIEVVSVKGTVLELSIRTTVLISPSGEIYRIPNGDIRTVRNFARGDFCLTTVKIPVLNSDLDRTTQILDEWAADVDKQIPGLLEAPEIRMEEGTLGETIVVTIFAKVRYGDEPHTKRRLLEIARATLIKDGVTVSG